MTQNKFSFLYSKKNKYVTIGEIREAAIKKIRKETFFWAESGAEDGLTLNKNIQDLNKIQIYPRVLKKIIEPKTDTIFFGRKIPSPLILAPMGHQTQFHNNGEIESAKGTLKSKTISCFTTQGRTKLDEIRKKSKNNNLMWQFFLFGDKKWIAEQINIAEQNHCLAIVVCLDAPVGSHRYKDRINRYDARKFGKGYKRSPNPELALKYDFSIIEWIKKQTRLPVIPKGILHYKDTKKLIECGVDAIWISNHAGRMFNSGISTVDALLDHRGKINFKMPLIVDGGVRRGSDIIRYLSLGADLVGIGITALYGLMANGKSGIENVINILDQELKISMINGGFKDLSSIKKAEIKISDNKTHS